MGDAGAYFFGYVLAATSILGNLKVTTVFALVPPVLFLLLPVLDTTQVFIRRLMAGKNPLSTPGKDHLHHRLLALGLSQRRVAVTLWGLTLVANWLAMKLQGMTPMVIHSTVISIVMLLGFTVWQKMRAKEPRVSAPK
jgi:UDP-GlcNAc:undecaprenyl-phosphate GlcNAc-1-phosphate transferase